MLLEEALYTYLIADAPLQALISDRVFPYPVPQNPTFPCLTYHTVGKRIRSTLTAGSVGLDYVHIQFDAFARSRITTLNIEQALMNALVGFRGQMSGLDIASCMHSTSKDMYEKEDKLFRRMIEFGFNVCTDPIDNRQ